MSFGSTTSKNYYELLGVPEDAPTQLIRETYRELARVYHPDSNYYSDIAPTRLTDEQIELFKIITAAYQTLVDPQRRKEYDELLKPIVSEKIKKWEDSSDDFWDKQVAFAQATSTQARVRKATFGQTGRDPYYATMASVAPQSSVREVLTSTNQQKSRRLVLALAGVIGGLMGLVAVLLIAKPGMPTKGTTAQQKTIAPPAWRATLDN